MADIEPAAVPWLAVIGKSLSGLCLDRARARDPEKFKDVLARVNYLVALGMPEAEAAAAAGTTIQSVRVLRHRGRKRASNGKAKKKRI